MLSASVAERDNRNTLLSFSVVSSFFNGPILALFIDLLGLVYWLIGSEVSQQAVCSLLISSVLTRSC